MRILQRLVMFAALVAALVTLWSSTSFEFAPSVALRLNSVVVPTAVAAVIAPTLVVREATSASVAQPQVDAARLLMVGTVLFALAAVVRKRI